MDKFLAIILYLAISFFGFSQNKFKKFDFLIGNWQGIETGVAGDGVGFRIYTFELDEIYIMERNQSYFPKTKKQPRGEVHRDIGIFSYNGNKDEIIYRSFNVEGFTNIFVLDSAKSSDDKFVFITREVENNPGDWKAKVVVEKLSETEFIETFDIAMDGENFKHLLSNHWYKAK